MRGDSMILLRSTGKKEIELNDATIKRPVAYGWVIVAYGILVAGPAFCCRGLPPRCGSCTCWPPCAPAMLNPGK